MDNRINELSKIKEITKFSNECTNCIVCFVNSKNELEVLPIKYKHIFEDMILLGNVKNKEKYLDFADNMKVSIAIWERINGYQFKGEKLLHIDGDIYSEQLNQFKEIISKDQVSMSDVNIILCKFHDIYHVTPGEFAGQLI
jgi:hypothetical protein